MGFRVDSLWQDVRYAARRLAHAPMFTCTAVIVLALGVGVNTAFFSLVNGVLFRPLSVQNADRLVNVARTRGGAVNLDGGLDERRLERMKERRPTLVGNFFSVRNVFAAVESGGAAKRVMAEAVSGNYFETLGLRPLAGRLLLPEDDNAGAGGPAVLSARFWRREFGADPNVIGRPVRVSGAPLTVVGVAPEAFGGMTGPNILGADLWAPMNSLRPLLATANRGGVVLSVFGSLSATATISRADAEIRVLGAGIDPDDADIGLAVVAATQALMPTPLVRILSMLGVALLAISSVVLFIACANLSGLVLARASRRGTEVAIRLAIGADRRRILQMQMVETALLSTIAGAIGFGVAWSLTRALTLVPIPEIGGMVMRLNATPDLRVFGFALLAAAVTTMLVGWMPAARMAETDPLRAWSASGGGGGVTPRIRASTSRLVAFQFGGSLSLLLIASLFVRSATTAATYDAGIDMTHVVAARLDLRMQNIKDADGPVMFERLLSGATPPGVRAALASGVPIGGDGRQESLRVYGQATAYIAHTLVISRSFFEMFDLQIVNGRKFGEQDVIGQPRVAIVNEVVAADLWPGRNPVGQSVRIESMQDGPTAIVVGVVRETDLAERVGRDRRYILLPLAQNYTPRMALLVSGNHDAASLATTLKKVVASATPEVAVFDVKPLAAFIGIGATGAGFAAAAIGAIGLLGLFIAMVGLYGTVASVVGERTREFGIMRALGADAGHIRRLVLRDAIRMLALGMAPGFVLTFLLAGFLQSWLLGLPAHDPVTFIVVPMVMFAVGCCAALIPAHRASKTDPTAAIRHL